MKKLISVFLAALLCFTLFGCGGDKAPSKYTVKFETFGGDTYEDIVVEKDGLIEEPMQPTNSGKAFEGWFADEAFSKAWDFETDKPTQDMTLYAKFVNRYNVQYYYNGQMQMLRRVNEGNTAQNVEYITASLKVENWYTDEDLTHRYDFSKPVTENLQLYAYCKVVTQWQFPRDMNLGTGWYVQADGSEASGSVSATDDGMKVVFDDPSSWTTYLRSPDLSIPNLDRYDRLEIKYKNMSSESNLKVGFFRTTDAAWDGKVENFDVLATNMEKDGEFATLTIDIRKSKTLQHNWFGTLYILRFEVKQANGDVNEKPAGTQFILGSVKLLKPGEQSNGQESNKGQTSFTPDEIKGDDSVVGEKEELKKYDAYTLDTYTRPFWEGTTVYNETCLFVGKDDAAKLMYPATEIVSVRSYDLATEYEEGKDYVYDKTARTLKLTDNTRIPYFTVEEYYPSVYVSGRTYACNNPEHDFLFFDERGSIQARQIAVTYRHNGTYNIAKPESQKSAFQSVLDKIDAGEPVKLLFYGDSITVGHNSSGLVTGGYTTHAPNADVWAKMVYNKIAGGKQNVSYVNSAVAGWTTQQGIDNLKTKVLDENPDMVFIAFGMNDYTLSPAQHIAKIKTMVAKIRESLPNAAICLISTMLPNPESYGAYARQAEFEYEYVKLLAELDDDKLGFANVTAVHKDILRRKRYYDMTGNNVNHVNDFTARMYAQTVLQTVLGD